MMKPYMPDNAFEVAEAREEIKKYINTLERITTNENGDVLVNFTTMTNIIGKLRQATLFADCLLYMMKFNDEVS